MTEQPPLGIASVNIPSNLDDPLSTTKPSTSTNPVPVAVGSGGVRVAGIPKEDSEWGKGGEKGGEEEGSDDDEDEEDMKDERAFEDKLRKEDGDEGNEDEVADEGREIHSLGCDRTAKSHFLPLVLPCFVQRF